MSGENFEKIREYLDLTRDGIKKLEDTGIVDQLPEEHQDKVENVKEVLDQLKKDAELIDQIKKKLVDADWENPTQEMVSSALAVSKAVIERIKTLPFIAENEAVKELLNAAHKSIDGLEQVAKTLFQAKDFYLALMAAEANPAAAVQVAWAGPGIAKGGIDFIRYVAPSLDTDAATKEVENKVFGCIARDTSIGALIGATALSFLGPPGAAAGGALGGAIGSIVGAVESQL